jgi:cytochrome c5
MRLLLSLIGLVMTVVLLVSCQSNLSTSAPPVTESFLRAGLRQDADSGTLAEGRKLFLNRCILCHALPEVGRFKPERVPRIVGWMSGRAHLTRQQQEAVTKYLLTVKAQEAL